MLFKAQAKPSPMVHSQKCTLMLQMSLRSVVQGTDKLRTKAKDGSSGSPSSFSLHRHGLWVPITVCFIVWSVMAHPHIPTPVVLLPASWWPRPPIFSTPHRASGPVALAPSPGITLCGWRGSKHKTNLTALTCNVKGILTRVQVKETTPVFRDVLPFNCVCLSSWWR